MAAKLKDLSVTSVDLVDQGANPDAYICLFKRDAPETAEGTDTGQQDAQDTCARTEEGDVNIMDENRLNPAGMAPDGEGTQKGMAQEPPAAGEGMQKGTAPEPSAESGLHPEVQKALADFKELAKRQSEEIAELKKSLEMEHLTAFAKKYEVLGKKADELAAKLYEMKKAGGSAYDEYVALLDESVSVMETSGMFREIGKNTQGSAGAAQSIQIKAAELSKSSAGGMTSPDAIIKAFEENPELAAQYEAEYMGGR